jgi:hypothetical protein
MNNIKMYCLCLDDNLFKQVTNLGYIPVGLGLNKFSSKWLTDRTGVNISKKNIYYGEHSFHYWLWKNNLKNLNENTWIGFCAHRRFWKNNNYNDYNDINFENSVLKDIPPEWKNYDVILGNKIKLDQVKWMKVLKYGKKALCRNPGAIFKKGRTIKFQFDMFHGNGILDKAITLLNDNDRDNFKKFVNTETSYNQGNMFICKSTKIMSKYYETIFDWLKKCENVFGFDLKGYAGIRLYAFLAERFLPYWFNKNTKVLEWPILFYDLRKRNLNEK